MPIPESHLNSQYFDDIVHSEHICLIWIIHILNTHHSRYPLYHGLLGPGAMVVLEIHTIMLKSSIQL